MSGENCGSCRWWVPWTGDKTQGDCRRYPPQATQWQGDTHYVIPDVPETFWCGEFAALPQEQTGEES